MGFEERNRARSNSLPGRKNPPAGEFFVYRYRDKASGGVVYIGKTNCSLKARVDAHRREDAFAPYRCDVDCTRLSNRVETDCVEKFLINYYKPCINLKDKVPALSEGVEISGLKWVSYESYLEGLRAGKARASVLRKEAEQREHALDLLLGVGGRRNQVTLPFFLSQLPTSEGYFQFAQKEAALTQEGYELTLLPGAARFLSEHYYEVLACIWKPVLQASDVYGDALAELASIEYAYDAVEALRNFAYNGYQQEGGERFVAVLPKEQECAVPFLLEAVDESAVSSAYGRVFVEWAHEENDRLPAVLAAIHKRLVLLTRTSGVRGFSES